MSFGYLCAFTVGVGVGILRHVVVVIMGIHRGVVDRCAYYPGY